ncbi:TADA1 [Bugula neritina]|uniref:TADA1 n=1 Tax=Bugula neritina TaxID=10212 RepID=A0A7J7J6Q6_BUGNE|nr:TADA1 [Bugula neritina]
MCHIQRFQPANQLRQVQRLLTPPSSSKITFASSSLSLLPDPGMVEGRLYVAAWETGLENVQSDIYRLISLATEELLKNLVSHVISCRRGYKISQTERVKQYVGVDAPMCYLETAYASQSAADVPNSLLLAQKEEATAVQSLARSGTLMQREEPITARDMFTSLMSNPDVFGSYTIYTLTLERLSSRLYHPQIPDHMTPAG